MTSSAATVKCRDASAARDGIPLLEFVAHGLGQCVHRAGAFGARGGDLRVAEHERHKGLHKRVTDFVGLVEDAPAPDGEPVAAMFRASSCRPGGRKPRWP